MPPPRTPRSTASELAQFDHHSGLSRSILACRSQNTPINYVKNAVSGRRLSRYRHSCEVSHAFDVARRCCSFRTRAVDSNLRKGLGCWGRPLRLSCSAGAAVSQMLARNCRKRCKNWGDSLLHRRVAKQCLKTASAPATGFKARYITSCELWLDHN